jgi:hypothetical protein
MPQDGLRIVNARGAAEIGPILPGITQDWPLVSKLCLALSAFNCAQYLSV